jgi:hypothetical protein
MSLSYQVEQVLIPQYSTRTVSVFVTNIYSTIYASQYRIYETVVRRYITKIVSRYLSPDNIEITRIETPTSYLETEYVAGRTTQLVRIQPILLSPAGQTSTSQLEVVA